MSIITFYFINLITIFIPVRNEEEILEANSKRLQKYLVSNKFNYFVIFGENGSTDNSIEIIKKIIKNDSKHFDLVSINNGGIGDAFRAVIQKYKFDKLIFLDIDLPTELNFIKRANNLLDQNYDIVAGYKVHKSEQRSFARKFISFFYVLLTRLFLGLKYKDFAPNAKAYKGSFLKKQLHIIDKETFFVIKIFYLNKNAKIIEIPVKCFDKRKSRFNILYTSFYQLYKILKLSILKK